MLSLTLSLSLNRSSIGFHGDIGRYQLPLLPPSPGHIPLPQRAGEVHGPAAPGTSRDWHHHDRHIRGIPLLLLLLLLHPVPRRQKASLLSLRTVQLHPPQEPGDPSHSMCLPGRGDDRRILHHRGDNKHHLLSNAGPC